ncbi:PLASTIDIC GLUCOSE TRANSPORTER 1-RELATED [Salix koriyanagi]|uniref:PLASTIDIC GLUCOSE TRANSPORTER 1-RELATED n=1 Tax=Salix koriyanagi TaxID=2511006 RepID=A0A9Q0U3I3_9ROSI|nr:PLASTIDIC GLUCOSE TRANSPORTER 1-RELATED [Salix koriyanagi]
MWVATVLPKPAPPVLSVLTSSRNPKQNSIHFRFSYRPLNFKVSATKQQQQLPEPKADKKNPSSSDIGWLPAFPHVLIASMSNFVFGYHIGVMNGPIVSVAKELGFEGNSILEGLVVSIFIVGAFLGSVASGSVVDKLGCRRTFQLDTIPLILGALIRFSNLMKYIILKLSLIYDTLHVVTVLKRTLWMKYSGEDFLLGFGIGVNTVLVPIYISEVAPTKYRGSLGTLCQIRTCLGIIASLFLDIPSETDPHWWRTILYIASAPGFFSCTWYAVCCESPASYIK